MLVDIRPTDVIVIRRLDNRLRNMGSVWQQQSSRYWNTADWPDGSTGVCNTAPGRRDARGKHTRTSP
ncbi:hypothetical protein TNCT_612121 [Trichonephila clavata]|uniref:Uncharacterized protein n=1 Tax=Trichonephila clavata TaxID=2740835 RepID=A0A8X6K818_TRICU|nr:hypothetical protein TNCT_612121 [Trichonephila clavata]